MYTVKPVTIFEEFFQNYCYLRIWICHQGLFSSLISEHLLSTCANECSLVTALLFQLRQKI